MENIKTDKAAVAFRLAIAAATWLLTLWIAPAGHLRFWECALNAAFFLFIALLPELSSAFWRVISRRPFSNR